MLRNSVPRIADIQINVIPALRLRGSLKAGIPLEIASTPVNAVVPFEKACSSKNGVAKATEGCTMNSGGLVTRPRLPMAARTRPAPTVRNIIARKKYVGTANARPDSRTPLKFTTITVRTSATARGTRYGNNSGKADVSWATPEDMETATVRT